MIETTKPGFHNMESSFKGLCKFFFKKNLENVLNFEDFLNESQSEIFSLLNDAIQNCPIKCSLKLESTYDK